MKDEFVSFKVTAAVIQKQWGPPFRGQTHATTVAILYLYLFWEEASAVEGDS